MVDADTEIATLNKQKLLLESVRNSTMYNVSSRIYYQYFTFKDPDFARNTDSWLIFLEIF